MRLRAESPARLNDHEAARNFFEKRFRADALTEQLLVAHVDGDAHCIHLERFAGEKAAVGVPVRQIIADALRLGSAGVILAHNHPSGDCRPSDADYRATRKLTRAADAIELAVLDHLIFAGGGCSSMRQMGLL